MRRPSFLRWHRDKNASGIGPSARQLSWPRRDELRPLLERWLQWLRRGETLDLIYLGTLALVLAFAAYLFATG